MMAMLSHRLVSLRYWLLGAVLVGAILGLLTGPEENGVYPRASGQWVPPSVMVSSSYELPRVLAGWVGTDVDALMARRETEEKVDPIEGVRLVGVVQVEKDLVAHLVNNSQGIVSVRAGDLLRPTVKVAEVTPGRVRLEYDSTNKVLELSLYPSPQDP
jgi:hypothetical protein